MGTWFSLAPARSKTNQRLPSFPQISLLELCIFPTQNPLTIGAYLDDGGQRLRWQSVDFESRVGPIVDFVFDFDGDGDVYSPLAIHDVACDVGVESPSTGSLLCECELFFGGDTRGLVVLDSAGGTHTRSTTSFAVRGAETGGTGRIGFVGVLPGVVSRRAGGSNEVVA